MLVRVLAAVLLATTILLAIILAALVNYDSLPEWAKGILSDIGLTPPTATVTTTAPPATVTVTTTYTSTVRVEATVTTTLATLLTATKTVTMVEQATRTATVTLVEPVAGGYTGTPQFLLEPIYRAVNLQSYCGNGLGAVVLGDYAVFWKQVETRSSGWTVLRVEANSSTSVDLVPPGLRPLGEGYLDADYAFINGSCVVLAFKLPRLLKTIPPGNYTLLTAAARGVGVECRLELSRHTIALRDCKNVNLVVSERIAEGNYSTFIDALLDSLKPPTLARLRSIVFEENIPKDLGAALWRLLEWTSAHIAYDYAKESNPHAGVYDPLTLARIGRGVCVDYAVFEAAVLAALNATPVVILYPDAGHATAATFLGGTILVLDQHPPPIELQDYLEYLDPLDSWVVVYILKTVNGKPKSLLGLRLRADTTPDLYPQDKLPPWVPAKALQYAAKTLRVELNPALATVIDVGLASKLSMYELDLQYKRRVSISKLYTPLLDDEWTIMLAEAIANITKAYYNESINHGALWASIIDEGNKTLVEVYAVPIRGFNIGAEVADNKLIIKLQYRGDLDPYQDVKLLIYPANSTEPCAGIVAQGYMYPGIPYTTADEWRAYHNTMLISISIEDVSRLAEHACGKNYYLLVWLRNYPVYAQRLQ